MLSFLFSLINGELAGNATSFPAHLFSVKGRRKSLWDEVADNGYFES